MRFGAWILMAALCGVAVAADGLPQDTNEIKSLTVEQAKALAQHKGSLSLNGLTTLSVEAARALAQNKGWLRLNGLTTLSAKAAASLRANPLVQLPDKFKR